MTCKSIIRGLHTLVSLLQAAAFIAVTFSYYVRLQNTTVQPIRQIIASRGNEALTKERISKFVTGKERELRHVQIASTISAAATIGVFSWPEAADTYWAARALWYTSMTLSFFSLISSHQARLLEAIPTVDHSTVSSKNVDRAAHLITWTSLAVTLPTSTTPPSRLNLKNIAAIYVWQSAIMQMSWAWVIFLVGLTLHVIRSLLPEEAPHAEKRVPIIFLVVTSLAVVNFLATGFLLHFILNDAEHSDEGDYSLAGSIVAPATPPLEVENNSSVNGSVESRVYFQGVVMSMERKEEQAEVKT